MPLSPYSALFLIFTLTGAILAISSSSWVSAWIGLELNLMAFIPLISSKTNMFSSEAALKYFLVQALGSATIIFSATMLFMAPNSFMPLVSLALILKTGSGGLHFWFPQIMEGLNWFHASLLMTVQKLAPMFLLSYMTSNMLCSFLISSSALCSSIVGAIGGLNQTSLRKILSFSSINHMSWMFFSMLINETSWIIYFSLYTLITLSITILFFSLQAYHFSDLINYSKSPLSKTISIMSLFSLGGLPPFSGFLPKWIILQELIFNSFYITLTLLLSCSLLTLYFYTRLSISTLSLSTPQNMWNSPNNNKLSPLISISASWNLFGLPLTSLLFIF
uniref:NADH-ubiquinone oxidoreductase chain 2 n=1 Tax=Engaewa subcoerulea TaxID=99762 RepID=A0A110AEP7_9EUCA|nr:NADH dehydrogenase subunit 2 [Engaewa subcoerulea]AMB27350.1 NADH dehydrogenase subunit 2 [Engaewa subcoerulea]